MTRPTSPQHPQSYWEKVCKRLPKWSTEETAWMAGLLEGEGYFGVRWRTNGRSAKRRPQLVIQLAMTDEDVVARAAKLLNCPYHVQMFTCGKRKPQYKLAATNVRARQAMEAVLPLMGQRRAEKIRTALKEAT